MDRRSRKFNPTGIKIENECSSGFSELKVKAKTISSKNKPFLQDVQ